MLLQWKKQKHQRQGFTLGEVLISFFIFSLTIAGLIFGYTEVNRMCEYSSMSLAAQSFASQGLEQMRAAQWDYVRWPTTNYGPSTGDDLGFPVGSSYTTNIIDTLDVPTTGAPISVTNFITVTYVLLSSYNTNLPPMRQIRSDVVWTYPLSGKICTNTAITLRAPDQ
jgi:Tfp pilus assembly protein PilV